MEAGSSGTREPGGTGRSPESRGTVPQREDYKRELAPGKLSSRVHTHVLTNLNINKQARENVSAGISKNTQA